jgi:Raf kinase inhibitor-like YbhB/YbcL family protein
MRKIYVLLALTFPLLTLSQADAASKKKLKVTSSLFKDKAKMPDTTVFSGMGCTGGNTSPDLKWEGAPEGTKSFAVEVHDPDAPTGVGFFHWTMWNIAATTSSLDAGAGAEGKAPTGAVLGHTDFGSSGYNGPCPPPGNPHRYHFTVYALDTDKLELGKTATGALLRFMVKEHTLAEGTLTGLWGK